MLILLDRDDLVVATLDAEPFQDRVITVFHNEREFEFEDHDGSDAIYREVQ